MTRRSIAALIVLLLGLSLLAGCGSSSNKSSGTSSTSSSSTPSTSSGTSSTPNNSSTSSTSGTTSAPGTPEVKAAVEQCQSIIRSQTKLPAKAKEKLEGACAEAAKGNTSIVKKVAREVCEETINNSSIPQSAKEQALVNCRKT